ncbi:PD-(D/E)XK nuclease superfamily [Congregibacter litoralis KT71]|uniref:PD-(D/E)XK nuclease superfamily n=1 Tax=Congregibacter litoralis KT71 TaxID=314285 RepID=A4AD47_9GAMM|nr:PD-(D/E)XK nuclease superfamily [Congregibacter litoralis KT71]
MPRHRGAFDPNNPEPYELSRSKLESFIRCPGCFWLEKAGGVKFPSMPPFNINSNTDRLLKRDFDSVRGFGPHPFMVHHGLDNLKPFEHPDLERWMSSLHFGSGDDYFSVVHDETNIRFGGGIDDIWEHVTTGQLHIVDYKSTSNQSKDPKPVSLAGKWKEGYKRQIEMYQWILRRKGFDVSDTAYFVYVDGLHVGMSGMLEENPRYASMRFATSLLVYVGDDSWVEDTLTEAKFILEGSECPDHDVDCEYWPFISQVYDCLC